MKYGRDFVIEPLPKKCHGQMVKPSCAKKVVMDLDKAFKNPPEIREYWRVHKQKQRSKQKNGPT